MGGRRVSSLVVRVGRVDEPHLITLEHPLPMRVVRAVRVHVVVGGGQQVFLPNDPFKRRQRWSWL